MYLLYSLAFGGLLVLALPYFLFRWVREPGYGKALVARMRAPRISTSTQPVIWLHAVSVGEVMVAATLLPELAKALPDARFVVSVITATGRRVAEDALTDVEAVDAIFFCPFDLAFFVGRVVRAVKPQALVVVETEIWPHLLREAKRSGAVTMIAGGRISDRSFPRYRLVRRFMARFLEPVDRLCMQNALFAERIRVLGASHERILVTGNVKFDATAPVSVAPGTVFPPGRKVLIAGSTLDPEEKVVLEVFAALRQETPELFLVLAPRHPHRFTEAYELAVRGGFTVTRRTDEGPVPAETDVMILDTLGELAALYGDADYVFVGGSLADWGGHNIIEPAALGKPVLFGPDMRNFADIAALFIDAEAAIQVSDAKELKEELRDLVRRPQRARKLGERARRVVEENRGASARNAQALKELLT